MWTINRHLQGGVRGLIAEAHSATMTPLQWCWCAVLPEDMHGADGAVTALCAHAVAGQHRVLVAHANTRAIVWDLRWTARPSGLSDSLRKPLHPSTPVAAVCSSEVWLC